MDLYSLGMTVQDYLHPPPQYLDLEIGAYHHRLVRLSSCGSCSVSSKTSRTGTRSSRLSFSDASCSQASLKRPLSQHFSNLIYAPASRQSSLVSDGSRRSSLSLKSQLSNGS